MTARPVPNRARALARPEHRVARGLGLAGLLVLWELLTRTGWVPALFLPSPLGVLAAGGEMLRSGELLGHVATSLGRILLGFGLGALGGVGVGFAVGVFGLAEAVGTPLIAATFAARSLPPARSLQRSLQPRQRAHCKMSSVRTALKSTIRPSIWR